ncbi:zf-HC2 domain-containing protein [Stigmatella sp. ncwal1]|uniref:Zf-HC2 domain-containing protein n=1 Tax=Stigmatella ashevillensis TaxID=2995309 RepID=A0ABT5D8Y8_9BACT|nr:zf-HC2 domain-containing protein [Stigmatella ashevillena]MDC0710129.1 zf-HC2 domain-containing protein [Stigmatella ashevillena]
MTCENGEAKTALQALFLGELEAGEHARLRAHAKACVSCGTAYERLSRVESSLEKRVLPQGRERLLEAQLLERLKGAQRAAAPERFAFWSWWKVALPMAAAAAAAVAVVVLPKGQGGQGDEGWQARKGAEGKAFGVRAFCIASDGKVAGEASPGGVLACPEGAAVQFSYTAPEQARLSVASRAPSGEMLQFFPQEGEPVPVSAGVDVPLAYSTPVQGGWLSKPIEVRARFTDARGQLLGETQVTLTPAK